MLVAYDKFFAVDQFEDFFLVEKHEVVKHKVETLNAFANKQQKMKSFSQYSIGIVEVYECIKHETRNEFRAYI